MKNLKLSISSILLMIAMLAINTSSAFAQTTGSAVPLSGRVIDKDTREGLIGAVIVIKDTTKGTATEENGKFQISIPKGEQVYLVVTYLGYKSYEFKYTAKYNSNKVGYDIELETDNIMIDAVEVIGSAPTAIMKGDTMQYNAGAFKTNPDATAEDLIAKMPGFEVGDDGSVTAQGESITRVYVDGKSFFKDNPEEALTSLTADMVESIQLFEEQSDMSKFTGADDGTRIHTINIVTKAKKNTMTMGDVAVGYGTDGKYTAKANVNLFNGENRYTIGIGGNNINQSALGGSKFYGRYGSSGISDAFGLKLNYSGTFEKDEKHKNEIGGSYIFNTTSKVTISEQIRQSLFDDEIYTINSETDSYSDSHKINFNLKSTFGSNMIVFEPSLTISKSNSDYANSTIMEEDGIETNNSYTNTRNDGDSYNFSTKLEYMRNITTKSSLSLGTNFRFSESNSDQLLIGSTASYDYDLETLVDSLINQNKDVFSGSNTINANLNYAYRIKEGKAFSAKYDINYNWSNSDNRVYLLDTYTGEYTDLYSALSNVFEREYVTQTAGLGYSAFKENYYRFNVGANYQYSDLQNDVTLPTDNTYDYYFNCFKTNARMELYFNQSTKLSISYDGSPSLPSVDQLQDVVNNSDPLFVSVGNPNLTQSFNNNLSLRYNSANVTKSTTFYMYGSYKTEIDGFGSSVTKVEEDTEINGVSIQSGAQISQTINIQGKWSANFGLGYSFPINLISSKVNLGGGYNFSHTPSIYNGEDRITDNNNYNTRISINSNISENIDFSLSNMASYSKAISSGNYSETITERATGSITWIFLSNFVFNAEYTYNKNFYLSDSDSNNSYNIINAGLGYKFLNRNAEVRVSAYDLLNESQSIMRSVGDQFVTDSYSNVLQRYIMFTFSYKFNTWKTGMKTPTTSDSSDDRRSSGGDFGDRPMR